MQVLTLAVSPQERGVRLFCSSTESCCVLDLPGAAEERVLIAGTEPGHPSAVTATTVATGQQELG